MVLFLLAARTKTEKIQTMRQHLKAGFAADLLCKIIQPFPFRVHDLPTSGTDQMGMGGRVISVVMIAAVGEAQFQDLSQFLEQKEGLVDGGQTGGGKAFFDFFIELGRTGVGPVPGKDLQNGQALGGEAETAILKPAEHPFEAERSFFLFR